MDLKKEFNELTEALKQQRDEIEVQIHLAGMDAKEEWKKAEKKREQFFDALGVVNDDTKEISTELIHATKVIGDELVETYKRISERLSKQMCKHVQDNDIIQICIHKMNFFVKKNVDAGQQLKPCNSLDQIQTLTTKLQVTSLVEQISDVEQ